MNTPEEQELEDLKHTILQKIITAMETDKDNWAFHRTLLVYPDKNNFPLYTLKIQFDNSGSYNKNVFDIFLKDISIYSNSAFDFNSIKTDMERKFVELYNYHRQKYYTNQIKLEIFRLKNAM